jgi:nickel transport protein
MAGEGHRAGFTLRAEDMPPPAPSVGPPPPAAAAEAAAPGAPAPASPASSQAGPAPGLEEIRLAVRDELSAQLGPLSRRLAESGSEPPSFREVIGGLGWLAGIFGFAFYWSARHPRAKPPAPRFASRV